MTCWTRVPALPVSSLLPVVAGGMHRRPSPVAADLLRLRCRTTWGDQPHPLSGWRRSSEERHLPQRRRARSPASRPVPPARRLHPYDPSLGGVMSSRSGRIEARFLSVLEKLQPCRLTSGLQSSCCRQTCNQYRPVLTIEPVSKPLRS